MSGYDMENWKWILGYEGRYRASDHGRIMSVGSVWKYHTSETLCTRGECILKDKDARGYRQVVLFKDGRTTVYVHRMVLGAFIGPNKPGQECNHIDGDKTNNYLSNLEWVTGSANKVHAYATGLYPSQSGSGNHNSKLTEDDIVSILELRTLGMLQEDIAQAFSVAQSTISGIINRKGWRHV